LGLFYVSFKENQSVIRVLEAKDPTWPKIVKKTRNQVFLSRFNKHTGENIHHKIKSSGDK
jgi:hypothetical protein